MGWEQGAALHDGQARCRSDGHGPCGDGGLHVARLGGRHRVAPKKGAWLADAVIVGENRRPSSQDSSPGSELAGMSRSSRKTRVAALGLRSEVLSISLI